MSIPATTGQLKSLIDQEITNKTQRRSILPTAVGALLKTIVDFFSGQKNTFSFPAHASLTSADAKKLVMNDNGQAKVVNYTPGYPGTRGEYSIDFDGFSSSQTVGAVFSLSLADNLSDGDYFEIYYIQNHNIQTVTFTAMTSPSLSHEFAIGASIAETLGNLSLALNAANPYGTCYDKYIAGTTITFYNNNLYTGTDSNPQDYALPEEYNSFVDDACMKLYDSSSSLIASAVQDVTGVNGIYAQWALEQELNTISEGLMAQFFNSSGLAFNIKILDLLGVNGNTSDDYMGWFMPATATQMASTFASLLVSQGYFEVMSVSDSVIHIKEMQAQIFNSSHAISGYFNFYYFSPSPNITTIISPSYRLPARLPNRVLGSLVSIDGVNALIDSSYVINLQLAPGSAVIYDPNIPYYANYLLPYYDGKVISLPQLYEDASCDAQQIMTRGLFEPIHDASPGGYVKVKQSIYIGQS